MTISTPRVLSDCAAVLGFKDHDPWPRVGAAGVVYHFINCSTKKHDGFPPRHSDERFALGFEGAACVRLPSQIAYVLS